MILFIIQSSNNYFIAKLCDFLFNFNNTSNNDKDPEEGDEWIYHCHGHHQVPDSFFTVMRVLRNIPIFALCNICPMTYYISSEHEIAINFHNEKGQVDNPEEFDK